MKMKKFRNIALVILILTAIFLITLCCIYNYQMGPVSNSDEKITVEVSQGATSKEIAKTLKEKGLIRSETFFLLYLKIYDVNNLKATTYELSPNMGVANIVEQLQKGNDYNPDTVTITFKEGINMRKVAKQIAANTNHTEQEVLTLVNDDSYLDSLISKYWFLSEDIKDKDIYYKLEGYLFPDTYQFENKEVRIETIFEKMLNQMDKILTKYKTQVESSRYSVHEILTYASIVELEGASLEDRENIVGVFENRLQNNMSLGSDVTTYYGAKVDMSERDLTKAELQENNGYNTRANVGMEGKLPVGPIALPSEQSIQAVLNAKKNDYFYFVADKYKKVYFTKTYQEHQKMIQEIKDRGDWITWE